MRHLAAGLKEGCTQCQAPRLWVLRMEGQRKVLASLTLVSSPPPTAAATGLAWRLATHTCASVPRAMKELCVTRRMTLPVPAQPSSATMGSATSQIEESPTAYASLASAAVTVSKVSESAVLVGQRAWEGSRDRRVADPPQREPTE